MRIHVMACLAFAMSGPFCSGSRESIYTERDIVADSMILGRWKGTEESKDTNTILIERDSLSSSPAYLTTWSDDKGHRMHDRLVLTRIGGVLFADIFPADDEYRWNMIPVHAFLRSDGASPRLTIHWMDPEWLRKYVAAHPKQISAVTLGDWVVLTDSTAKVRRFLLATLNMKGAYQADTNTYMRVP